MIDPLFMAIENRDLDACKAALKLCTNIEITYPDKWDMTPLNLASFRGLVSFVEVLIDHGADLNAKDNAGCTALHNAITVKKIDVVRYLVAAGADLEASGGLDHLKQHAAEAGAEFLASLTGDQQEKLRLDPLQVVFNHVAGDRVMQEVYQFDLLERITYIRAGVGGPVEAVLREAFSKLDETSTLQKAFEEHTNRGGARTAAEVMPHVSSLSLLKKRREF